MRPEVAYAEQVGFIERPTLSGAECRLHMMGDEFCANAAASLGAYLAYKRNMREMQPYNFTLEVSGQEKNLACVVTLDHEIYHVKIELPIPSRICESQVEYKNTLIYYGIVRYSGISHIVIRGEKFDNESKKLLKYVLHRHIEKENIPAIGSTLFSEEQKRIMPLVYVDKLGTEIWENSCGTASASVAAYIAHLSASNVEIDLIQPSGYRIQASAVYKKNCLNTLTITENVSITTEGIAFV